MCPSIRAMAKPDRRARAVIVVLPVVVGRIAEDGVAADDVEGQGLAGQPRRRWPWPRRRPRARESRVAQVSTMCPPSDPPTTATQPLDAQVVDQPPLHFDDVADGDGGEIAWHSGGPCRD